MLPDHSINVLVSTIIQKSFPDEYKQRLAEAQTIRDHSFQLPIFTLDYVLFPGMPLHLHIFEPRYRLMVRRCLEGTRTFGVLLSINGEYSNIGTTTVIESSNILPDGRQILVTRGDRRFKVLSFGQQDGYTTTKVKYIDDDDEEESSENIVQVAKAKITLNKYLNNVSTPETGNTEVVTMEDLTRRFGTMPARPKAFSFWISSILNVPNKHKQDVSTHPIKFKQIRCLKSRLSYFSELWPDLPNKPLFFCFGSRDMLFSIATFPS